MDDYENRYQLFDVARQRTEWTIHQLWVQYLTLGGVLDLFAVDAFLNGVASLDRDQQDILAIAVNERLDDLYRAIKIPLLGLADGHDGHDGRDGRDGEENPVEVLDTLFRTPQTEHVADDPVSD